MNVTKLCAQVGSHFWHLFHMQQTEQTLNRTRYLFYFMSVAFQFRCYFYGFSTLKRTVFWFALSLFFTLHNTSFLVMYAMCAPTAHILTLFIPVPIFHLIFSPIKCFVFFFLCFVFMHFVVVGCLSVFIFGCHFSFIIICLWHFPFNVFTIIWYFFCCSQTSISSKCLMENWNFLHFPDRKILTWLDALLWAVKQMKKRNKKS